MIMPTQETRGVLAGLGAFFCWGTLVLYWYALERVDAVEILAHRIVWCFAFTLPLTLCLGRVKEAWAAAKEAGTVIRIFLSALFVAVNWGLYIYAVVSGRVLETSLGAYMTPLMNVLLGCVLLRERMSRLQALAVALAATGVLISVVAGGSMPWLSLALAVSFGFYGLLRKTVHVESVPGLLLESALLTPLALAWLLLMPLGGTPSFNPAADLGLSLLLVGAGVITAVPLLLFAYAARHMSLISLGVLHYLTPSITMLLGVFVLGAKLDGSTLITFVFIWAALALYTWCGLRRIRIKE